MVGAAGRQRTTRGNSLAAATHFTTSKEQAIEGWGFTAYRVSKLGPMARTLIAVDPNAPKAARFITRNPSRPCRM